MTGAKNPAMEMLNRTIDRDIEAQKAEMSNKVAGANAQSSVLSHMQNQFHNDIQAEQATRVALLAEAQQRLNAFGSQNDAVKASQGFKIMKSDIDMQMEQARYSFNIIAQQRAVTSVLGQAMDDPTFQLPPSQRALLPKEQQQAWDESRKRLVPIAKEFAKDPEAAKTFTKEATPVINALQNMDEIKNLMKDYQGFAAYSKSILYPGSEAWDKREEIKARLVPLIGNLRLPYTGPGILTDNERELIGRSVGDPTAHFSFQSTEMKKFDQTIKVLEKDLESRAGGAFHNPQKVMQQLRPKIQLSDTIRAYQSKK
jgi:hypothetical protein